MKKVFSEPLISLFFVSVFQIIPFLYTFEFFYRAQSVSKFSSLQNLRRKKRGGKKNESGFLNSQFDVEILRDGSESKGDFN